jgi:phosphatidylglycerol:prolipoprotein diacylglycerol transferase
MMKCQNPASIRNSEFGIEDFFVIRRSEIRSRKSAMRQVLFEIPLPFGNKKLPIFGFGLMLACGFVIAVWAGVRRARKEGIHPDIIWDLAMYCLIGGIIGARLFFFIFEEPPEGTLFDKFLAFFEIWKGGLVFYGSMVGGFLGYCLAYVRFIKKAGIATLKIADLAAPSIALGIFFGRLGCFLNGCCWGQAADPALVPPWRTVQFPANSGPQRSAVEQGWQSAFGFVLPEADPQRVQFVEPGSPAALAGLQTGDVIVKVGDDATESKVIRHGSQILPSVFYQLLKWPAGRPLHLTVERAGGRKEIEFLPAPSLPLHPAQLYSSLDGLLLFVLLTAFFPFRRRYGEVLVLLMAGYAVNRFSIEQLRNDTPADFLFHLTLSQDISLLMILIAAGLFLYIRRKPPLPLGAS